ncbi:MAG: fibronectin type III domain-containing protein [Melioribacteraceae bacterium]|nr:fibronectin type III domain-containing protein [Melioribacteraceae bacterium]
MKKTLLFILILLNTYFAQTNVFTDNFSTSQGATYFTSGKIGTSNWQVNILGADWGGRINNGLLELTNDASTATNVAGWVYVNQPMSNISSPFNSTLSSNSGLVTWTFNMRQVRTDPAGFGDASYGVAFILGSTSQSPQKNGTGYAVVLGQSGSTDPIRLVKFSAGLQNLTNLITSNTSGLNDFGNEYISIKVTYNPTTNTWELFLRNDGTTAFSDPLTGTLVSQGTIVDNTYTSSSLSYFGAYWQGSTTATQNAVFDNFNITVNTISIPVSPVAKSATNITNSSFKANWSGINNATKYFLDISTQSNFSSFVTGYENKEIAAPDSNFVVTGLNGNTNYFYRVRAFNSAGTSGNSNVISVTTLPNPPSAPIALPSSNITQTGFTANWNSVAGANNYILDVSTQNNFSSFVSGYENKIIGGDTLAAITGLNPNTNYFYRVRASNISGTSDYSNTISVTTLSFSINTPTAKQATNITQTSFTANWSSVNNATKYFLDVSTKNDFSTFVSGYENKQIGGDTLDVVSGLTPNTSYFYRVRASDDTYTSFNSNIISVTTLPNIPNAPIAKSSSNITNSSFRANWSSVSGATKYFLDVSTQSNFSTFITGYENKEIASPDSNYTVSGLIANSIYFYRVRANNIAGTSDYSNTISVTTYPNPPIEPNATAATNVAQTSFVANWEASISAYKYYLDVSTQSDFSTFVVGYQNKDVGNNLSFNVSGLNSNTTYYYRVRAENIGGISGNSNVISVTTFPSITKYGIIVNEWSQGSGGAKEWVELLIVEDNLNIQNFKLIDGNNSLSITFSGVGFQSLRKGSLIVIYNGADVDGLITPDLNYDGTTDKKLIISSLNNSGTWALTRTTGWSTTTGAFSNTDATDVPKILNNFSTTIFTTPKAAGSTQIAYFNEDTEDEAFVAANWLNSTNTNGTPGEPNGGKNSIWITTTLATEITAVPNPPIATNATNVAPYSFTANWNVAPTASKYFLDVATDNLFNNLVPGYDSKDVGNSTSANVTGLNPLTNYYYRVRANNILGTSGNSNTIEVTTLTNQTRVQFASTSGTVYENSLTFNLTFTITNPGLTSPTTFEVAVIGGTGNLADINNYSTQTVTFPAGSSSNKILAININNDGIAEGSETIIFKIQNVTGGNSAIVGTNSTFTLTIYDPIIDYYSNVNTTLNGLAFKTELHNLIKGHTPFPYTSSSTDVWDILMDAYEDPANPSNVILIYSSRSQAKTYNASTNSTDPNAWNREHVFAQSRGGFSVNNSSHNPGIATDAHNLAPEDASVNSDRSNKDFDIGGLPHPEAIGCFMDADSFEPRDAVKGDVARILFYMDVRYEGTNGELQIELRDGINTPVGTIGKLSTLLLWHQQDPPDAFEIARNNKIYNYQKNKNPFIDHPEWVAKVYGLSSAPTISNINRNVTVPNENQNLIVSANIIDDVSVSSAQIIYTINNGNQKFVNMTLSGGTLFTGTIPEIDYKDGDLLEYKIKAVDNQSNEKISENYKVFTGLTPISTLHQVNSNGELLYNGLYAKVKGVATVPNGLFSSSNLEVNIQDNTGGIVVYKVTAGATPFIVGKNYTVAGSLTQYNGLAELVPDNVLTDIIDNGLDTEVKPTVKTFAELIANAEQYEGMLIKVKNVNKISGTWASSQNLTVTDGTSSAITLRVSSGTNLSSNPEPTWPKDVVGIFTQFDSSLPYTSDYQLKPRSISDIQNVTLPTKYIVTTNNYNPTVGSTITINAQLADNNGEPIAIAGKIITWNSSNGGVFSSPTSVTNINGIATVNFTVSNQSNVNYIISAVDNSTPQITGQSNVISTIPNNIAGFIVNVSNENSVAGTQINVTAQLIDNFNNPIMTSGIVVNWTSQNGGSFSSQSSVTNSNGTASVTFTTSKQAGIIHIIKATTGSFPNIITSNSNQIITKAGNPAKYIVQSNDFNPVVNTQIFIYAQLVDENDNPVFQPGRIVNWSSTNGGSFSQSSSTTNVNGLADVIYTTSKKANIEHLVSATDNNGLTGTSNLIKTKASQPSKLIVTPSDLFPQAGSEINVKCQLVDEFENPVNQFEYVLNWNATNGGKFQYPNTLLDENGFSKNQLKVSSKAGDNHIVNVKSVNDQNIFGVSKEIKVIPANGSKYIVNVNIKNPYIGNSVEAEAQLVDQFNNIVKSEGVNVSWSATNGGNFLNPNTLTDANGKTKNVFTVSNITNTKHIITATDDLSRKGSSEEIITVAVEVPILVSPLNNSKNVNLENTFIWNVINNATGYEFQLSTDNSFNNVIINQFVTENKINISSLELEKKYFWRVRSRKGNGLSNWSEVWSFNTLPKKPMKPNLISPINNTVNQNVITNLRWQKIDNADKYNLQIAEDLNFNKIIIDKNDIEESNFRVNTLTNQKKYFWKVKAINQSGESEFSEIWNFTTIDTIYAPSNLTAYVDTNASVILNWKDNSNNENGFSLQRLDPGGIDYYQFDEVKENVSNYTVTNLEKGKTFFFRVIAFNISTKSSFSNIVRVIIPNSNIKAPSNLKAIPDINGYIQLTWIDNSNDEKGFIVYRQDEANLSIKDGIKIIGSYFIPIDTLKENSTTYLDKKTVFNKKYSYQVLAFNQNGISMPVQLKKEIMPLKAPTNLIVKLVNESVQLDWKDNSDNETAFIIQRATRPKLEYEEIAKLNSNTVSFLDSKVLDGKKYFYNVYAIANEIGLSAFSNVDSIYLKMKTPTNLVAKQITNQNKIELTWKDNSASEKGYLIERKELNQNNFSEIYKTISNISNFTDESVINKKNYVYRLRGYNEDGYSDYSNESSILVGIEKNDNIPNEFKLEQNFPNPFNPETVIKYSIPLINHQQTNDKSNVILSSSYSEIFVTLKIYDILGNEISTLVNEYQKPGIYNYTFSIVNYNLPSGVYFYKLQAGEFVQIRKMILMK